MVMHVLMITPALQNLFNPVVKPSVFDFWAGLVNPTWAWRRTLARVVERYPESSNAVTLRLKPNRHFAGFTPGQHITVTAEVDGRRVSRAYSLTGLPRADHCVSVTIREVQGGALSAHLCRQTRVGDVLELSAAFGEMTLPEAWPTQKHLLLAAGSGITPMMTFTRQMAAAGMPCELTLLYWAQTREQLCFASELRQLAAQFPALRLYFVLTRQQGLLQGERSGRLSEELLTRIVPDWSDCHVACCGPENFVQTARDVVAKSARSFQAESFSPPIAHGVATENVQVYLSASGRTLSVSPGMSLLNALEAEGVYPEHGCRMGICNSCACVKSSGTTQDMINGDISAESTQALRLCISRATTDITLDI
jgi:ferredoxin-NADP reductase